MEKIVPLLSGQPPVLTHNLYVTRIPLTKVNAQWHCKAKTKSTIQIEISDWQDNQISDKW